jgi:hypothetical protein
MQICERRFYKRRVAGSTLLSQIRLAALKGDARDWTIGRIGGFELTCKVRRSLTAPDCETRLVLQRTGYEHEIEVGNDLTAIGLIARIEHILDRFETDLEEQIRRKADAIACLAGYQPRLGESFPLQGELDDKLARLAELDADLAKTQGVIPHTT